MHTHKCMNTHIYTNTHTQTHEHTHTNACTHTQTHAHTHRYRYVWLCRDQQIDIDRYRSFPDSSVDIESTCNAGDPGFIPGLGRSTGKGIGYPLLYSGLENSMDCIVHGVAKSWT